MRPRKTRVGRTRDIEALDSVRFTSPLATRDEDPGDRAPTTHAFLEVLWALIIGDAVVIPQTHAFVSIGFVDIAQRLYEERPSAWQHDEWEPLRLVSSTLTLTSRWLTGRGSLVASSVPT